MKTQMKAIIASAVVIALALSAVAGVTYSWFSDSEEADVTVTTGKIKMITEYSDIYYQSEGESRVSINLNETKSTILGGEVAVSDYSSSDASQLSIQFTGMCPGDSVGFRITNAIENSIKVNYLASYTVTTKSGTITDNPFSVEIDSTEKSYDAKVNPTITDDIKVTMTDDAEGDKEYSITFFFQVIQGNMSPSVLQTKVIPTGTTSSFDVNGTKSSDIDNIKIEMPAFYEDVIIAVNSVSSAPSSFVISEGSRVLGGVDVDIKNKSGATIHDLGSNLAKVNMIINGNYNSNNILIFHESDSNTPIAGVSFDNTSLSGKTIISFETSKFSSYYAVYWPSATFNNIYYETLSAAVEAYSAADYKNNTPITLLKNIDYTFKNDGEVMINIDKDVIIDFNGKIITASTNAQWNKLFNIESGSLKLVDNENKEHWGGIISKEKQVTAFEVNKGSLEIDSGLYTMGGSMVGTPWGCKGNILIKEGIFNLVDSEASMPNMIHINGNICVKVENGTFTNTHNNMNSRFFYLYYGELIIDGGSFISNNRIASIEKNASLTINNGIFKGEKNLVSVFEFDGTVKINGGVFSSNSRNIAEIEEGSVTIKGGNFTTIGSTFSDSDRRQKVAMFDLENINTKNGKFNIDGGSFTLLTNDKETGNLFWSYAITDKTGFITSGYNSNDANTIKTMLSSFVVISGGDFDFDPSELVMSGYTVNINGSRWAVAESQ